MRATAHVSPIDSKYTTCYRIKVYHLGACWISNWISVWDAREKWLVAARAGVFSAGRLVIVPLRGRVWGTVVPRVVGFKSHLFVAGCCGEDLGFGAARWLTLSWSR